MTAGELSHSEPRRTARLSLSGSSIIVNRLLSVAPIRTIVPTEPAVSSADGAPGLCRGPSPRILRRTCPGSESTCSSV